MQDPQVQVRDEDEDYYRQGNRETHVRMQVAYGSEGFYNAPTGIKRGDIMLPLIIAIMHPASSDIKFPEVPKWFIVLISIVGIGLTFLLVWMIYQVIKFNFL